MIPHRSGEKAAERRHQRGDDRLQPHQLANLASRRADGAEHAELARTLEHGQRPRIVDVKVGGVSMVLTRRSEYNSYIRNHGGQVEPLIDELEARAKR